MKKLIIGVICMLMAVIAVLLPSYIKYQQLDAYMTTFLIDKYHSIYDEMQTLNGCLQEGDAKRSKTSVQFVRKNLYLLGNDLHHFKYQISHNDNWDKELYAFWENISLFEDYFYKIDDNQLAQAKYQESLAKELDILLKEHRQMSTEKDNWIRFIKDHAAYRYGN